MAHESPQDVEQRIERDREQIDATIQAIQQRFSPGQLFDQAMGYMRSNGSDVAVHFGRAVKENPFPLLLTGVGLAWLISSTSRTNGHAYPGYDEQTGMNMNGSEPTIARAREAAAALQRRADETTETFQERLTEAKAKALNLQRRVEETAADFSRRVESMMSSASSAARHTRERAWHASERAADMADRARYQAVSLFQEQPLIAIAAGIGLGTLLGALMPPTRMENEALGKYGEAAKRQLKQAAQDVGHRVEHVATETAQVASQTAESAIQREASTH